MISSKRSTLSSVNPPQGLGLVKALLAEKDFQPLQPRLLIDDFGRQRMNHLELLNRNCSIWLSKIILRW